MPDLAEALRRYADAGDPLDLDAIMQRRRRPPILRVAAVLVALAAVAAVVTLVRGGDPATVTTSTVPGLPSAFLALTADGQLQVRSSRDGGVERTVATMTVSGPVNLAVTPDGRSVYLARDRPFKRGECNQPQDTLLDEVVRVDLTSRQIEPIGRGAEPALSPDGRRLAYVRQVDGICRRGVGGQELVIRDVASGRERTIAAGAEGVHLMDSLSWAPGS